MLQDADDATESGSRLQSSICCMPQWQLWCSADLICIPKSESAMDEGSRPPWDNDRASWSSVSDSDPRNDSDRRTGLLQIRAKCLQQPTLHYIRINCPALFKCMALQKCLQISLVQTYIRNLEVNVNLYSSWAKKSSSLLNHLTEVEVESSQQNQQKLLGRAKEF